jgi:RNA polymerase sigma-70 factor (ECF subfamily)
MCLKDHEIVELFFERSEQAITELILKYGAAIRNVASNILRDALDVEECQSDTYLQVWNRIPPTRPNHLGAYVCRIARNVCLKRYHANTAQKRNSHYDVALEELEATIPALSTVESDYDAKELSQYLNMFLKELSREERYLFMRRYWFGDGVSEIARNLGISAHTASVRLFRLRQKLQTYLQKEGMIL